LVKKTNFTHLHGLGTKLVQKFQRETNYTFY